MLICILVLYAWKKNGRKKNPYQTNHDNKKNKKQKKNNNMIF